MEPMEIHFMEAIALTVMDIMVWALTAFVWMTFRPVDLFSKLKKAVEVHFSPLRALCTHSPLSA